MDCNRVNGWCCRTMRRCGPSVLQLSGYIGWLSSESCTCWSCGSGCWRRWWLTSSMELISSLVFTVMLTPLHLVNSRLVGGLFCIQQNSVFTTQCYAEHSIAMASCLSICLWRSIQHNNTTLLIRMRFCVTSLLAQWGQICFAEFLKIISSFFAQNFCTDRVDILLCFERKKTGFFVKIWHWPPRSIVGIGVKHAHDSDHAECKCWGILGYFENSSRSWQP